MSIKHKCEAQVKGRQCKNTASYIATYFFGERYLCKSHRDKTERTGYSRGTRKIK